MTENTSKAFAVIEPLKRFVPKSLFKVLPSLINAGLLFLLFVAFDTWYRLLTEISPNDFNEVMLATSPTQFFGGSFWLSVPIFTVVALMIWKRKMVLIEWKEIQGGKKLRWIICICVVSLSWAHISFPFNYFLLESAFIERFAVLALAILTIWRPFFLLLYVFFPLVIHFGEPLMVNHWSIAELPMRVLMLFSAQLVFWLLFPKYKWKIGAFVFMLFCVIAGNYFPAGIGKIKMGWLTDNHIYLLLSNMYADGWVSFLSQETLSEITHFLSKYNLLLKIGCLIFEFGCLFILIRKRWSIRFFLLGFLTFHTLVFIMTGIFFWPWIALEVTLLIILRKKNVFTSEINNFSIWHILLSMCLIFTATKWLRPSVYVWYDSPVNYTYSFEVHDKDGKSHSLPANFFWPKYYELAWTNGFHFIHDNPTLNIIWGVSFDGNEVKELLTFKDADEVLAFEKQHGENRLNSKLTKEFRRYMIDFVKNKDYKRTLNPWFRAFSAPPQRLVFPDENIYDREHDIVKIDVYQKLSIFNGEDYKELRRLKVMTIDIPQDKP